MTVNCSQGASGQWYVNYTHREAHKGYGAARFSELVGVPLPGIMAIGDGPNDIDMFRAVGFPVAMSGAPEPVLELARFTTGSQEEDGVAQAIERFVL